MTTGFTPRLKALRSDWNTIRVMGRALLRTAAAEIGDGTLLDTISMSRREKRISFAKEYTFASLLEKRAKTTGDRPFLTFDGRQYTYLEMNELANRVAAGLASLGARPGGTAAIFSPNCPDFLHAFFATQKLGMTAVPVNVDLRGEGLAYILQNSGARFVFVHHSLLGALDGALETIAGGKDASARIVLTDGPGADALAPPAGARMLDEFLEGPGPTKNPACPPESGAACLLMYTSGTTGRPKGVVYKYGRTGIKQLRLLGHVFFRPDDAFYTCLPLFHANALFLTTTVAMTTGARVSLGRKFSASRFWDEVRRSRATTFNSLGAMISILMKQPPKETDRKHDVRLVVSAACPAALWKPFEDRFGVKLVEAYGAVDGGGFVCLNLGDGPVGSVGRPLKVFRHRLVDEAGKDVPTGEPGELVFFTGKKKVVEYHKDGDATERKMRDGWLRTGDLFRKDEAGYLYFIGRNTDSMRRRGENVSALEIESAVEKHPMVLECAAYGVPSDLGEQDIMVSVVPVEAGKLDPAELHRFLQGKLARFAIPRYIHVVAELPKTETHRTKKKDLAAIGVTPSTWDSEKAAAGASGAGVPAEKGKGGKDRKDGKKKAGADRETKGRSRGMR